MKPSSKSSSVLPTLLILTAGTLWGSMGLFVRKLTEAGLSSLQITFIRLFFSFLLFAVFTLIKDPRLLKIRLKDLWCFLGTGILSLALFTYFYFEAVRLTSLSTAAVLLYTEPALLILFSAILFKEKFTPRKGIALVMTVVGCILVTGMIGSETAITLPGLLFGIGSAIGYALYSVFGRYAFERGYEPLTVTFYTFFFASVALAFFADLPDLARRAAQNEMPWVTSILLAVFASFLPYLLYTMGLRNVENGKAGILASMEPVVATLLGMIFYHEIPDVFGWIGIVAVLSAIVLMNIPKKEKQS